MSCWDFLEKLTHERLAGGYVEDRMAFILLFLIENGLGMFTHA